MRVWPCCVLGGVPVPVPVAFPVPVLCSAPCCAASPPRSTALLLLCFRCCCAFAAAASARTTLGSRSTIVYPGSILEYMFMYGTTVLYILMPILLTIVRQYRTC